MNEKLKKFGSKISVRSIAYPAVLVLLLAAIWFLFMTATRFISKEINKVFSDETPEKGLVIDQAAYALVAKRLNISTDAPAAQPVQAPLPAPATTTATTTEPAPLPALDKQAISIGVFNGTSVTGKAGSIKSALVAKGFKVDKTGNAPKQTKNTLEIKESKKAYATLITDALAGTLAIDETKVAPESNKLDAMVTIGR